MTMTKQERAQRRLRTTPDKLKDVEAVTPDIIEQAAQKLKQGKSDPSFSFSSDCIKYGPEVLYSILSVMYQLIKASQRSR